MNTSKSKTATGHTAGRPAGHSDDRRPSVNRPGAGRLVIASVVYVGVLTGLLMLRRPATAEFSADPSAGSAASAGAGSPVGRSAAAGAPAGPSTTVPASRPSPPTRPVLERTSASARLLDQTASIYDDGDTDANVADLAARVAAAADADDKRALAADLAAIDSPDAVDALLRLLGAETDGQARVGLLAALANAEARDRDGAPDRLAAAAETLYAAAGTAERTALQDTLAATPGPAGAGLLRRAWAAGSADRDTEPAERVNAMEATLRLAMTRPDLVPAADIESLNSGLRLEAQASEGADPDHQSRAVMGLALRPENLGFLREMRATASDPAVRGMLERLAP